MYYLCVNVKDIIYIYVYTYRMRIYRLNIGRVEEKIEQ